MTSTTCPNCLRPDAAESCRGCGWAAADARPAAAAQTHQGSFPPPTAHPTPPPANPADPAARPRLVVLRGQRVGHEYPLYPGRNTVGRFADEPVDIDLVSQEADGQVWSSRRHAAVTCDGGLVLIEDLHSLNGTWVNGSRIYRGQPRPLKPGDVVQIGTVQLRLVV